MDKQPWYFKSSPRLEKFIVTFIRPEEMQILIQALRDLGTGERYPCDTSYGICYNLSYAEPRIGRRRVHGDGVLAYGFLQRVFEAQGLDGYTPFNRKPHIYKESWAHNQALRPVWCRAIADFLDTLVHGGEHVEIPPEFAEYYVRSNRYEC